MFDGPKALKEIKEIEKRIKKLKDEVDQSLREIEDRLMAALKNDKKSIAWELRRQQVEQMQKGDKLDMIIQIIK